MKKMMMILAAVLMASVAAQADLTWRVDINGAAADASTNTAGWTGWNVMNGSTNVAGLGTARSFTVGSVTGAANMIVRLSVTNAVGGQANFSTMNRSTTNTLVDPVSFWTDGIQGSGTNTLGNSGMLIRFEGLTANATYDLKLFSADYGNTYTGSITQDFFNNITGMWLGSITNWSSQASSLVPTSQYDSRYTLSATVTADANGFITIREWGNTKNERLNGFEVAAVSGSNPDTDGDGMPDTWEEQYYGGPTNADASATAANGINTVLESYVAGLNPTNANSTLQISVAALDSVKIVSWTGAPDRLYAVYWTTNLLNSFAPLQTNYTGAAVTDSLHNAAGKCFYMLEVRLP